MNSIRGCRDVHLRYSNAQAPLVFQTRVSLGHSLVQYHHRLLYVPSAVTFFTPLLPFPLFFRLVHGMRDCPWCPLKRPSSAKLQSKLWFSPSFPQGHFRNKPNPQNREAIHFPTLPTLAHLHYFQNLSARALRRYHHCHHHLLSYSSIHPNTHAHSHCPQVSLASVAVVVLVRVSRESSCRSKAL